MSKANLIDDITYSYPTGDVIEYFDHMNSIMQLNSGNNSYHMATHVSHSLPAPLEGTNQTHFMITDSTMDIVDISKGYLKLRTSIGFELRIGSQETNLLSSAKLYETYFRNCCYFFLGFKSGSQIIKEYRILSYGQKTDCFQSQSRAEQTITYNCKSESERRGRPGMYSCHEDVMNMSDCVCGTYIQQPIITGQTTTISPVEIEVIIQIDDLLPLSGMTYYPVCISKEMQLAIRCELAQNMVFCPIPLDTVFAKKMFTDPIDIDKLYEAQFEDGTGENPKPSQISTFQLNTMKMRNTANLYTDYRFHQCGDYARGILGVTTKEDLQKANIDVDSEFGGNAVYYTFVPTTFRIEEAKSYVYGFGLKPEAIQQLRALIQSKGALRVPAQWCDYITMPQTPDATFINANTNKSLFECDQVILTFPNSPNQMTVTRNPHFESFTCRIGSRINIPDQQMTTGEKAHSEMILSALSMDTLFTAPKSLLNSLEANPEHLNNKWYGTPKEDDSDYMLVCDLERGGNGIFSDGITGINVPIRFEAMYMNGRNNPHFYECDGNADKTNRFNLRKYSPNLFTISDACWLITTQGPVFIKDATKVDLTRRLELKQVEKMNEWLNDMRKLVTAAQNA